MYRSPNSMEDGPEKSIWGVEQKAWICGPAEDFVEHLREIERKYPGLEHVILHWPEGMPRDAFLNQVRLFAKEVMPEFQSS